MIGRNSADVECSENKVEGEDNSRTVDCLRGRLLAERMASRIAREEADKLGIRLLEVEMLLEKEGKSRNRAEKKLKSLVKKLQRINISQSTSKTQNLETKENTNKSPKGPLNFEEIHDDSHSHPSSCSSKSISAEEDSYLSCGDQLHSYEASRMESSGEEDVDDSMALVPVEEISLEVDREKFLDATVEEVLELLKRAKEEIQSSMERKKMSMSMIKVG